MNRNRLIQMIALVLALAALLGASLLVPRINTQREDFIDNEPVRGMAPKYVIAAAALGAFRGIAVDMLWYRAEMLKREGKFFDAKALRDWIVMLQPRFPEVWRYQSWDMVYNISVQTGTPQERWDWVSKGIRLLRDEGIPNNPTSVPLYRELSWTFFHKIGQFTDDMHWYYKAQLAQEWQELLGAPTEGGTTEQAQERFRPVAEMAERYFLLSQPSQAMLDELGEMAAAHPAAAERIDRLGDVSLSRMVSRTRRLAEDVADENRALAERLRAWLAEADARAARAARDPILLFEEESPEAAALMRELRAAGFELDVETLRRIGWLIMLSRYSDLAAVNARADELVQRGEMAASERDLLRFVVTHREAPEFDRLLAFLRAKVLVQEYHMDPSVMHGLMMRFGPVDWRHPAAQALYWGYLGVQRAGQMKDRTKIDILNTDRNVIHSLQALFHYGRLSYDPMTQQVDLLPDPRFVDEYPEAMRAAIGRQQDVEWSGQGNEESFEAGHENFLIKAVQYAYLYGDEGKAREYYDDLITTYGSRPHNLASGRYTLPLEAFVAQELGEDWNTTNTIAPFIESLLLQSFRQGLKLGRGDVFNRYMRIAQNLHERYQRERSAATPTAPRERLLLLPFQQMVAEHYSGYMRTPQWDLMERGQVYRNTPLPLAQGTYRRWFEVVRQQAAQQGIEASVLFPPPPGLPEEAPAVERPGQPAPDAPIVEIR